MLELALQAAIVAFMIGTLGGVGLGLTARDVRGPLAHGFFVALSLVLCWVVCPAIAVLLLWLVPLDPGYATGLLLLALAPCAPFAPAVAQTARGDPAYMAAFVLLSAASTVVMMPILAPLLVAGLSPDPVAIARPLVLFVLLPMLAGMVVRTWSRSAADGVRPLLTVITHVFGAALLALTAVLHGGSMVEAIGSFAIATQVLFIAAVTAAAYMFSAGLAREQRNVVTLGVCTRNLGAALAPLTAIEDGARAMVMIVIAVPVTLGLSIAAARWLAWREPAPPPSRTHAVLQAPADSA